MKDVVEKYQQNALEAQPGRTIHESFEAQVGARVRHLRLRAEPLLLLLVPLRALRPVPPAADPETVTRSSFASLTTW